MASKRERGRFEAINRSCRRAGILGGDERGRKALKRNLHAHRRFSDPKGDNAMKRIVLIATCALLACPVVAETAAEKTGVNSTLGLAPTTNDFVSEAAISDMFEIQSSKMASAKLAGPEKDFADQMIKDHTKTTSELTSAATADNIPIPSAVDSSHQKMLDKLSGLDGERFRRLYFSDQVSAHKDAVSLFGRYGKSGDNAKLKSWASQTLPALQHHLDMARGMYKNS
jgi:putative membrane protein